MATVSPNFPKQTSRSWIFDAASGVRVKLSTTIAYHVAHLYSVSQSERRCWRTKHVRAFDGGRRVAEKSQARFLVTSGPHTVGAQQPSAPYNNNNNNNNNNKTYDMAPTLPDDILHLLCEQLADQEQFDALFNCACASRSLAIPALSNLYRYVFMSYHLESMYARAGHTLTTLMRPKS
jgi:hypothetical protein